MKSYILATIALCLLCTASFAQNTYSIKGTTVDTASKAKLITTIAVLDAKDSILRKFTHTASDGSFAINGLPAGKFLLLVAGTGYNDYTEVFTLGAPNKEHNFGDIKILAESKLLKEVTIKADVAAIKINGDTIIYNAKAYVIQPNDRVEDLLKQLPGITVDKDGHITAQGERVQRVLVDGEEFFGDDPTLVTKNLRADMVDKLQVYDAKSDQAKFTGIDDGVKIKTINVQLKEDRKTGVFGKADAGVGNPSYYEGQLIYNKFKPKDKFALYGTVSNNGKLGLGGDDNNKVGAGDVQISDGAASFDDYDQLDNSNTGIIGIPQSKTGGVHWDDKWNKDKESINTNYKIGQLGITNDQISHTQTTITPTIINNGVSNYHTYNNTFRQKIDATYNYTFSTTANLRLRVNATDRREDNLSNSNSITTDASDALVNTLTTNRNSKDRTKILNADIFYTKRFKKAGRTLSWDINEVLNNENETLFYKSDRYTAANTTHSLIDQRKPDILNNLVVNNNITYSEPITASLAVTINYGFALDNRLHDSRSYNASTPNVYNVLDSASSNVFKVNQITNQLGAVFNYRWSGTKKVLTFGVRANDVSFKQIDDFANTTLTRNYINWRPQLNFNNRISQGQSYSFGYNGSSTQPGINLLQPIRTNTNQLNITIGNPNLTPTFAHNFNARYANNQNLTGRTFTVNGNFGFRVNPVVTNRVYDTLTGVSTTRYENLNHNKPYNYTLNASLSRKFGGIQVGLNTSTYGRVNYSYNNNVLTKNNYITYNIGTNISANAAKVYDIYLYGGPTFTTNQSSPHAITDDNSFGFNLSASTRIYLPGKFQISSNFNDSYNGKTKSLPAKSYIIWNASLYRSFFKDEDLQLSLTCNNILNQDYNSRYTNQNTISETSFNTIKRYFMFTATWNFTKYGKQPAK